MSFMMQSAHRAFPSTWPLNPRRNSSVIIFPVPHPGHGLNLSRLIDSSYHFNHTVLYLFVLSTPDNVFSGLLYFKWPTTWKHRSADTGTIYFYPPVFFSSPKDSDLKRSMFFKKYIDITNR